MPNTGVARVLIDTPLPQLDRLFDFRVPAALDAEAQPGVRVRVPFRSAGRMTNGYLIERVAVSEHEGALSDIDSVVSTARVVPERLWTLVREVADRSAGSASDVLRLAIPPRFVRAEKSWLTAETVESARESCTVCGSRSDAIDEQLATGERLAYTADPRPATSQAPSTGSGLGAWAVDLAARACRMLGAGKSSVLVVPDYRDREQLITALQAHVRSEDMARLDSQQTGHARYRAYLRCLEDRPTIVVGNRSAAYAPVNALGLIAIWDDADPLLAEPLAPYAHARDVALIRQRQSGAGLLVMAHYRSVEAERLVHMGWMRAASAPGAVRGRKVIVTALQDGADTSKARIPSTAWRSVRDGLETGPVLIQVGRPGYSPTLACRRCRAAARCARCGGPLAQRQNRGVPVCSWCSVAAHDWSCGHCGATQLSMTSVGSTRTAEELGRAFSPVRVIVADGDHPVTQIDDEPVLVVATPGAEPRAPGGFRAVLLLDGERMLARESLNAAMDCVRWWSNAASLAADDAPVILAGVDSALAKRFATWQLDVVAAEELAARRELSFPPAVRLASVTGQPELVRALLAQLDAVSPAHIIGPAALDDGAHRALIRFPYAKGADVARQLRAGLIELVTSSHARQRQRGSRQRTPRLRVRLDDPTVL